MPSAQAPHPAPQQRVMAPGLAVTTANGLTVDSFEAAGHVTMQNGQHQQMARRLRTSEGSDMESGLSPSMAEYLGLTASSAPMNTLHYPGGLG